MLLIVAFFSKYTGVSLALRSVLVILIPGTFLFLIGLYDDIRGLGAKTKLAAQVVAGLMLYGAGFKVVGVLPLLTAKPYGGMVSLIVTILWVLWISNALNLIDGLDGLAVGVALFSSLTMFIVSIMNGNQGVGIATIVLAGAVLGFLRFNFNPATIFLGDSGSLFIGFLLSALSLAGQQQTKIPTLMTIAVPVVSLTFPLLETILSVLRRFLSGTPLFQADREHIHHKLLEKGLSHRQVVMILYSISAICAVLSLFLLYPAKIVVFAVTIVLGLLTYFGLQRLRYRELSELARVAQRTIQQKTIIVNDLAVRRLADSLSQSTTFEQTVELVKRCFEDNEFDAFQLAIRFEPVVPSDDTEIASETLTAEWNKGAIPISLDESVWSINLELITEAYGNVGYLRLIRRHRKQDLLIDVNLLVCELQPSLCAAAERIVRCAVRTDVSSFASGVSDPTAATGHRFSSAAAAD